MKQGEYIMRVLRAKPGHMLTEATEISIEQRTLSQEVWLGAGDDPANWREVAPEEVAILMDQQRASCEAARKRMLQ